MQTINFMKKNVLFLNILLTGIFVSSCENDDPKYPEHDCQLPSYKEFVGEQQIDGVEYEFYRFTPENGDNPVPQVLTPYAFVTDVELASDKTSFELPYSVKFTDDKGFEESYIVAYISADAFDDLEYVKTITIPAGVIEIYGDEPLFDDCHALTDVYVLGFTTSEGTRTPIEVESESLGCDYDKVTLHVKKGDKTAWKSAREWHKFKNISDDL